MFFGLGLVISLLIVVESADVRRLYFWDLAGAAIGCLLAVPLQRTIGPPAMVLLSLVAFAGLGLAIAIRRGHGATLAGAGLALTAVAAFVTGSYDVRTDDTKTLKLSDDGEGDWGAVFRVDAVDLGDVQIVHHDGLWGSSIWRYDGTRATTARFDTDDRQIPWAALGRTPDRILIIGAAGGNEIQAALTYGVGQVDAVELNPVTHDLLTDTFAEYSGNIANLPNVNYVEGDGRTFLARASDDYDLIWFVAPDSYAASNAATSGAFVLSESYLYTREMIETAFDHLTPNGLMVAQFGDFDFDTRPTRTARYLVTARDAVGDQLDRFDEHVILVVEQTPEEISRVSTIVLSPSAFDAASVDRVVGAIDNVPDARGGAPAGRARHRGGHHRRVDRFRRRDRRPTRRRLPVRHQLDQRRSPVLLALHAVLRRAHRLQPRHGGQRDRDRGAAAADAAGRRRDRRRDPARAAVPRHPQDRHRPVAAGCPSDGGCWSTSPRWDSASWSSRSR